MQLLKVLVYISTTVAIGNQFLNSYIFKTFLLSLFQEVLINEISCYYIIEYRYKITPFFSHSSLIVQNITKAFYAFYVLYYVLHLISVVV